MPFGTSESTCSIILSYSSWLKSPVFCRLPCIFTCFGTIPLSTEFWLTGYYWDHCSQRVCHKVEFVCIICTCSRKYGHTSGVLDSHVLLPYLYWLVIFHIIRETFRLLKVNRTQWFFYIYPVQYNLLFVTKINNWHLQSLCKNYTVYCTSAIRSLFQTFISLLPAVVYFLYVVWICKLLLLVILMNTVMFEIWRMEFLKFFE